MTTSTFPAMGGAVDNTSADSFIPELWSDEIVAAYKSNLILAGLVRKLSMQGKKGDTIHIPKPTRGVAAAKAEGVAVTIQSDVETEVVVTIDQHWEYSRFIEDITATQALDSLRKFYTDDAGYALATQVDDDLWAQGKYWGDDAGTGLDWIHSNSYFCDASATVAGSLTAYAADTVVPGDVFTDLGFRQLIKLMDDADVPMDGRTFAIPPALRAAIMGIDRYVSSDFVNGGKVPGGKVGELYGIDIAVSSNSPVVETAADNAVNTQDVRAALLFHRDTVVLAEQMGVRSQAQYKQEFLSNLYTSDMLYGVKTIRPESGFVLVVNDAA